jgi:hypothetical protein
MRAPTVLLLGTLLLPTPLPAQQSGGTLVQPMERPPSFCVRGKPLPGCQWFTFAEFAVSTRLADQNRLADTPRYYFSGEVGALYNVSSRSAVGGGVYLGGDDDGWRLGVRPRYRYWIADAWAVDAAAGVLVAGDLDLFEGTWPGFTAQLGVGWQDLVALTTQVEIIETTQGTWTNWYVGIQAGSYAALAAAPILWLIALLSVDKE